MVTTRLDFVLQGLHLRRLREGVRDQVAAEDAQEEHPPQDQGPGVPGVRLLLLRARQPQDPHQGRPPKAQGHRLRRLRRLLLQDHDPHQG